MVLNLQASLNTLIELVWSPDFDPTSLSHKCSARKLLEQLDNSFKDKSAAAAAAIQNTHTDESPMPFPAANGWQNTTLKIRLPAYTPHNPRDECTRV